MDGLVADSFGPVAQVPAAVPNNVPAIQIGAVILFLATAMTYFRLAGWQLQLERFPGTSGKEWLPTIEPINMTPDIACENIPQYYPLPTRTDTVPSKSSPITPSATFFTMTSPGNAVFLDVKGLKEGSVMFTLFPIIAIIIISFVGHCVYTISKSPVAYLRHVLDDTVIASPVVKKKHFVLSVSKIVAAAALEFSNN
jgi:hypothetical protein